MASQTRYINTDDITSINYDDGKMDAATMEMLGVDESDQHSTLTIVLRDGSKIELYQGDADKAWKTFQEIGDLRKPAF